VVLYHIKAKETAHSTQNPITETPSDALVHKKKLRSCHYATKVMFQGVITKPYPEHDFDGRISLRRVSELSETKKYHTIKGLMIATILLT
jgi:hypothetical protein